MIALFRRFRSLVLPYRGLLMAGAALAVAEIAFGLLEPWPLKIVVDDVLVRRGGPGAHPGLTLCLALGLLLGVALADALSNYWSTWLMESAGQKMGNDLRRTLFEHLQRLSLRFHGGELVGDLASRVTGDADRVQDVMVQGLSVLVPNVLMVAGMVIVMVVIDPIFTAATVVASSAMVLAIHRSTHAMKRANRQARKLEGAVAAATTETLSAIQVVQAFSLESRTVEAFDELNQASLEANLRAVRHQARLAPLVDVTAACATTLVLGVGAQRVMAHRLSLGVLLVFISYLGKLYKPVKDLSKLTFNITRGTASAERIHHVLAETPDVADRPGAKQARRLTGAVTFDDVSFSYGREPVLDHVSVEIDAGEVVALVGATGSGKTTMASLIPRFFDPDQGSVAIDGSDVRDVTLSSLRAQVGLVLQDSVLFRASIYENIALGRPGASDAEVAKAARLALVDEFVERLPDGMATIVGERGAQLSGGQRQRVAIARAMLRHGRLLVLDEPTSALDAESESLVVEALENLMRGRTTVFVAHRLSTIRRADRIVVLQGGRIVEQGTHRALVRRNGSFAHLARLQGLTPASRARRDPPLAAAS